MIDWRHWHNEPFLIGGMVLLCWAYAVLTGPLRDWFTTEPFPRRRAFAFYSSLVIFYLAVGSPFDQISESLLLSAHMLQHVILVYPSAALFLIGIPPWLIRPITSRRFLRPILRFLTHPIICGFIFAATMTAWHAPVLYNAALQDKVIHVFEHLMFFGSALFYWWPILSSSEDFPHLRYSLQMLYQVGVMLAMQPVAAYMTFSRDILYPTYEYAPRIIPALSPLNDQILGGAVMVFSTMFVGFLTFAWAFFHWYQENERRRPA